PRPRGQGPRTDGDVRPGRGRIAGGARWMGQRLRDAILLVLVGRAGRAGPDIRTSHRSRSGLSRRPAIQDCAAAPVERDAGWRAGRTWALAAREAAMDRGPGRAARDDRHLPEVTRDRRGPR